MMDADTRELPMSDRPSFGFDFLVCHQNCPSLEDRFGATRGADRIGP